MQVTHKPSPMGSGEFVFGCIDNITFAAKIFQNPSRFGINGGRISLLEIRQNGRVICNYQREWNIHPVFEVMPLYESILDMYN